METTYDFTKEEIKALCFVIDFLEGLEDSDRLKIDEEVFCNNDKVSNSIKVLDWIFAHRNILTCC